MDPLPFAMEMFFTSASWFDVSVTVAADPAAINASSRIAM
jgi:hypothetical protein